MYKQKYECLNENPVDTSTPLSKLKEFEDVSKKIVSTAGFVPLDVQFKRFEQAGIRAQFNADQFTSNDYRQLYLSPNNEIYPEDDLEVVQEKLQNQTIFIKSLKAKYQKLKNEPEKESVKETVTETKEEVKVKE